LCPLIAKHIERKSQICIARSGSESQYTNNTASRTNCRRVALLTPHYDVFEWVEPDWVFDTARNVLSRLWG
jgi:hypothetical protein